MFKRKIYNKLLKWKNESKGETAMLVEGARRIGKSTIVEEFAKEIIKVIFLLIFPKLQILLKKLLITFLIV